MVNIKEHQQSTKGTLEKVSYPHECCIRWWESRGPASSSAGKSSTHTHSSNVHTHLLYVCVHILRPLSLFFPYPAHRWLPEELERRAVWVSFLISFSFFFLSRDVVVLIVKRKERYSRQLLSVTGNEKRNIGGKCVSSLYRCCSRPFIIISTHNQLGWGISKKERKLGRKKKGKKNHFWCVWVCETVWDFVAGPGADGVMIKPIEKKGGKTQWASMHFFFIDSGQ
jgi:hypothetical protein